MILKFDHVAYTCNYESENRSLQKFYDHKIIFRENKLKNLQNKMEFLTNKDLYHNIIYLEKDCNIPIEITSYKSIEDQYCDISVIDNKVEIWSCNLAESIKFFSLLGFKMQDESEKYCNLTFYTIFEKSPVFLEIKKSDQYKGWCLDNKGYCCLAFLADNAQKESIKLSSLGYLCTDIESLTVNGRRLEIFFVQGKCGEVVEIFSIKREEKK